MQKMLHKFTTPSSDGTQRGLAAFGMYCTHCGHVEQVLAKVATEWVAKSSDGAVDAKP